MFAEHGVTVLRAADGDGARRLVASAGADLILLDSRLAKNEALSLCLAAQAERLPPIIMLAEDSDVVDHIVALEVGAEDLLPAPVNDRLLLAKIRSVLRRSTGVALMSPPASPVRKEGAWRLKPDVRRIVSPSGQSVSVTQNELQMLRLFMNNPGAAITNERVAEALGLELPLDNSVRTAVSRLRRKLLATGDGDPFQTIYGVGYVFEGDAPNGADRRQAEA